MTPPVPIPVPWPLLLCLLPGLAACNHLGDGAGGDPDLTTTGSSSTSELPGDSPTTGITPDFGGADPVTTGVEESSDGTGVGTGGKATCGDGLQDPGEGCDDGPANSPYAVCTDECQLNACGDGKVLLGVEGCDEGPANVDSGYCKADCQLNVCGDGLRLDGIESCDDGANNGEIYGGCDAACTVNRCGDGQLDVGHEECDAGPDNGREQGGEIKQVGCDLDCGLAGRRIFLSSQIFTGDLGGRVGADLACQIMAEAAGFKRVDRYRALLGDVQADPWDYVDDDVAGLPFILPSGLIVAKSWVALVKDGPGDGITMTETGVTFVNKPVWTNLGPVATAYQNDPASTCASWSSAEFSGSARVGWNAMVGDAAKLAEWKVKKQWLSYLTKACSVEARLYCIEAS